MSASKVLEASMDFQGQERPSIGKAPQQNAASPSLANSGPEIDVSGMLTQHDSWNLANLKPRATRTMILLWEG